MREDVSGITAAALPADSPAATAAGEGSVAAVNCANCGVSLDGDWCAKCGQRVLRRHTVPGMLAGFAGRILNMERGLLHTVWQLTVAPGEMIRSYLAGRTVAYTHPAAYLLLCFAAFALTAELFSGAITGGGSDRMFVALLVPSIAAVSWVVFRTERLHYAEHLIAVMYLLSHAALIMAVLQVAGPLADGVAAMVLGFTTLGLGLGYMIWGWTRLFPRRPLLAGLGGVLSLVIGAAVWVAGLATLLRFWR